jgi:multiple sugar transport system substrate-binding protein
VKRSAFAFVLLALLGSACGAPSDAGVVRLEFWGLGREGEVVAQLLPEFARRNPGIQVEIQQIPWNAAHEKLLTAYAGGSTPDLSQLGNTWLPELVALNALEDLGPFRARSEGRIPEADYFPGIWATNVIDGTLYGVPWYVDTRLLFYRTDLLRQAGFAGPPRTWAEWEESMARIKTLGGGRNFAILLPTDEFEQLLILALQQDEPLLTQDGTRGNFLSPGFRRAFTFYVDMFRKGWAPIASETQISNVWQEFAKGYFVYYITGPWNIGEFKRRLPQSVQDDWMTAPMPGPDGPGASIAGGASLVLFRKSRQKPEAWKLLEFLSEPEIQARFYELTGNLPSRRTAWLAPAFSGDPYTRAFGEQLNRVEPAPQVPEWERIVQKMRLCAEEVIHGKRTIDDALAVFNRDVDELLEKRRWLIARKRAASRP